MLKTVRSKTTIPTLAVFWLLLSALLFSNPCRAGKKVKNKPAEQSLKTEIREKAETSGDNSSWEEFDQWMQCSERCSKLKNRVGESEHEFTMREVCFPEAEPPSYFRSKTLHLLINDLVYYLQMRLEESGFEPAPKLSGYYGGQLPGKSAQESSEQVIAFVQDQDPLLLPSLTHLIYLARYESSLLDDKERAYLELRLQYIDEAIVPQGMAKFDWSKRAQELLNDYKTWNRSEVSFPQAETDEELIGQINAISGSKKKHSKFILKHLWDDKYQPELKMMTAWNATLVLSNADMALKVSISDPLRDSHVSFTIQAAVAGSYFSWEKQKLTAYWLALSEIKSTDVNFNNEEWRQKVLNYHPPGASRLEHQIQNTPHTRNSKGTRLTRTKVPAKEKNKLWGKAVPKKPQEQLASKSLMVSIEIAKCNNPSLSAESKPSSSSTKATNRVNRAQATSKPKSTISKPSVPARTLPQQKAAPLPSSSSSSTQQAVKPVRIDIPLEFDSSAHRKKAPARLPQKTIVFKPAKTMQFSNRPGSLGLMPSYTKTQTPRPQHNTSQSKIRAEQSVTEFDKEQKYAPCPLIGPALRLPTYHK